MESFEEEAEMAEAVAVAVKKKRGRLEGFGGLVKIKPTLVFQECDTTAMMNHVHNPNLKYPPSLDFHQGNHSQPPRITPKRLKLAIQLIS